MSPVIFLLTAKLIKQPEGKGRNAPPTYLPAITANNPKNIRKSSLDFTALLGEINPDMPYLCRRGQSGPERDVFASFPSVRREPMKKIVKSSIFCEKTSKFLRFLSFKP